MQLNNNCSKSGRTLVPTKRYQSYIDESINLIRQNKKAKNVPIAPVPNKDKDESTNNYLVDAKFQLGNPPCSNKKLSNMGSYTCRHCNVLVVCSLSQDEFIKVHHLQDRNKECYDKGFNHCPNKDCKRKFSSLKKI